MHGKPKIPLSWLGWLIQWSLKLEGLTYSTKMSKKSGMQSKRCTRKSDLQNTSQCFEIWSTLRNMKQGSMSVTECYNRLIDLWQEMDLFYTIPWKCAEYGVLYNKVREKDRIFDFLQGLKKDLDEVPGHILEVNPLPSLCEVFSEVRWEESRKKVMLKPSTLNVAEEQLQGSALAATRPQFHKRRENQLWCEYCEKPNHTKETCWDIHGQPPDWKPRNQRKGKPSTHIAESNELKKTPPAPITPEQMEILKSKFHKN